MGSSQQGAPVRLAEIVGSLSLGIDLGFGQPMEHVLRQCLIALRLSELLGLDETQRCDVYYVALLVNVGCHTDAHEQARWFGDDIALRSTKYAHDPFSLRDIAAMVRLIGSGSSPLHRVRTGLEFVVSGHREVNDMVARHAALARELAAQLGLADSTLDSLAAAYERWDGRGWPDHLAGDQIPIASRIVQVAEYVEVAHRGGGVAAAVALAERRRGSQFDPSVVDALAADAEKVFGHLDDAGSWDVVIDAEPALAIALPSDAVDDALLAISRFVDMKSPFTIGHSQAVAELSDAAARYLGLSETETLLMYRAGLVHDYGRLGVSNSIWDKPGPLTTGEWERVRLYPYLTERMLQHSAMLEPLARIAVQQRERVDGDGYPRRLSGSGISHHGRILAAADAYQAMREPRAHRPARTSTDAATELRAGVKAGSLDADAVDAVLAAAGHRIPRRKDGPSGLTAREIDVLKLAARGCSNKEIATQLVISAKTVGNHIEHIYTKIGASNRAEASLFAMRNGLLPDECFPTSST